MIPDNAHLIDGRYPSPSNRNSKDDGGDTPSPSEGDNFSHDCDNEDHFAVEMAPPAKRGRVSDGGREPRKGRKVIVKRNDKDNDEGNDVFMANIDKLLKGDNINSLAFE